MFFLILSSIILIEVLQLRVRDVSFPGKHVKIFKISIHTNLVDILRYEVTKAGQSEN